MATPVAQLLVRIAADTGALVRGGRQSERALGGIGKRAGAATKQLAALGAAAAAAGTAAMLAFSRQAIAAADAIAKTSAKLGISAEALQEWRYAAERAGIESKTFDMALQRFIRRAAEAAQGTGEAKDSLKALGITLTDANGQLRPTEELLGEVANAFQRIPSAGEQLRLAFKLFDSEGAVMVNMLRDGAEGIDTMRKRARELGIVISDDMARKAEVANDELSDMADVLKLAGLNIALEFMPVMRQLANIFTSGEFQAGVRDASSAIGEFISWIQDNPEAFKRISGAGVGFMMGSRLGLVGALIGTLGGAAAPEVMGGLTGDDDDRALSLAEGGIDIGTVKAGNNQTQALLEKRREMWLQHQESLAKLKADANAKAAEVEANRMLANVEKLREGMMTEAQLEMTRQQEKLEQLRAALDAELLTRQEYAALKEQLEQAHQAKLTEIAKRAAKDRAEAERREMFGKLNATASFFGDLASLAEAAGDDAFKQQKALAIASALIGSIESATHAFNWGTKIGGPVLGAAFAAAATAAQVARVAQIKSVQPGSGGSASGGGSFVAPASPAQVANSQQTLLVQGIDANSLWRGDNVRDLAERLIEFQENGGRVVVQ